MIWLVCRTKTQECKARQIEKVGRGEILYVQHMDASVVEREHFEGTGLVIAEFGDWVVEYTNGQKALFSPEAFEHQFTLGEEQ